MALPCVVFADWSGKEGGKHAVTQNWLNVRLSVQGNSQRTQSGPASFLCHRCPLSDRPALQQAWEDKKRGRERKEKSLDGRKDSFCFTALLI